MDEKENNTNDFDMDVDIDQVDNSDDNSKIQSPKTDPDLKVPETKVSEPVVRDLKKDFDGAGDEAEVQKSKSPRPSKKPKSDKTDPKSDVTDSISEQTKSDSDKTVTESDVTDFIPEEAKSDSDETVPKPDVTDSISGARLDSLNAVDKLRKLGYDFNTDGELRQFDRTAKKLTDKKFEFNVKDGNRDYNQRNYEKLGEVINEYVYHLLETRGELERVPLDKGSFVFVSQDWNTNDKKLLLLIHGSGVVRAGQWARRLIINDSINDGTQLPYIERAKELGYSVVVLNTNDNKRINESGVKVEIKGSESPVKHAVSAWNQFISKSPAKNVAIVAHSYGGVVTASLAKHFLSEFEDRVFSVMFTDSVHSLKKGGSEVANLLEKIALNYIAANEPLGTPISDEFEAVPMVSAGHDTHEWTSATAFEDLFKRLEKKFVEQAQKK